jgi:membrane associated rhomboid family serine protease
MDKTRAFYIQIGILLIALFALAALLGNKLQMAFLANPWINGFIALMWVIGIIHALNMVYRLRKEYIWLGSVDSPWVPEVAPDILEPLATMVDKKQRLTSDAREMLLDAVSIRLNSDNDTAKYLTALLIFLGLLGTFWGLLETVRSVGDLVGAMSLGPDKDIAESMLHLKSGLAEPLSGMGTAFSSSLFGLVFSLILGFVYLQAQRAKNTFFSVVESTLNVQTILPGSGDATGALNNNETLLNYLASLLSDNAESVRSLAQSVESNREVAAGKDSYLNEIIDKLGVLSKAVDHQGRAILKLAEEQQKHALYLDDETRRALCNSEKLLKTLIGEVSNTRESINHDLAITRSAIAKALAGSPN